MKFWTPFFIVFSVVNLKYGLEMLTIIYVSGYISHFFKVSQNRREEAYMGTCPNKGRFCCL